MEKMFKDNKAFTLIELLVVIFIIGVLSFMGLSSLGSVRSKTRDTVRKADMQNIYKMLVAYQMEYGGIPVTYSASRNPHGYTDSNTGGWDLSNEPVANPSFMDFLVTAGLTSKVPIDPVNKGAYIYRYYCYPGEGLALGYYNEANYTIFYSKYKNPDFICL